MDIITILVLLFVLFGISALISEHKKHKKDVDLEKEERESEALERKAADSEKRAEKLAIKRAKELEVFTSCMPRKLSQLSQLVSGVIDTYDFSECKNSIELHGPTQTKTLLNDYSDDCKPYYARAIKEFIEDHYHKKIFPYWRKEIKEEYNQLVERSIEIGARVIAKQIGIIYIEDDNSAVDNTKEAVSSSNNPVVEKKIISKTKKWAQN